MRQKIGWITKGFTERIDFLSQNCGKNRQKWNVKVFQAKKSSIPTGITEKIDFWRRNQSKNGKKLKKKKVLEPKIGQKRQKYEILKNWAENWSLEPKLDRKWA